MKGGGLLAKWGAREPTAVHGPFTPLASCALPRVPLCD